MSERPTPETDAAEMSERKRGIICAYCGMAWGYEDASPTPELIKEACDHESVCEKNPYTAQIRELQRKCDDIIEELEDAHKDRDQLRYILNSFLGISVMERYDSLIAQAKEAAK